ncbi:MXAN_5187 C-terminal domain-containing protein [Geobacter sp. SVR]|uniref:MXAN_5187 C-terminal domain-containing protein n=1 Tax=Geobacter sp. SVR TaxID=2495594 RepID=UPI00143EF5E3|nr:MXAN_5187 C-terminal domain-containing protein [Geobacter sp. SVR]BCS52251.1 hypothetical protein GSVR_05590 [Geobacter sp. SVR]GCF85088.1 hypothetical protein GSbR_16880 [Geobacter sp. SVR]
MGIVQDLTQLELQLDELIRRYERFFIGLEKREPLQLLSEIEKTVRRYLNVPINNTMYKHKYTTLVARFNTYREHWNRTVRQIEEGRYSRDRFICDLHERRRSDGPATRGARSGSSDEPELDRLFREFGEARRACNLPVEKLTREKVAAAIEKSRPALAARLGTEDLTFRVVVEDGKPRIKARRRT